ncbi:VOC family protein [Macrococcus hajekii]|uniref:VOC family protein n=1 Tax=Macrococcus hajekii TaxID=198482 RepID=A0A4R6BJI9_9STAP|nr:VOC family protein [Macrococcus hajekii]TDM01711.1 VOC family protein [Macrococcus hajekii]GGB06758.1 VOC family protein [Macrococcus hajekii]
MASLIPYLSFENTKEALTYYEDVFGATDINRVPVGREQADQFGVDPDKAEEMTMHSEFEVGGQKLYAADRFSETGDFNRSISLSLNFDQQNPDEVKRFDDIFTKIAAHPDTEVAMPLGKQFWGGMMGALTDKYGINWMFNGD